MSTNNGAPRNPTTIESICSHCGHVRHLSLAAWRAVRKKDTWPNCKNCGQRIYPVQRRCTDCQAVLRNGNLGACCALCQRRRRILAGIRFQIEFEKAAS